MWYNKGQIKFFIMKLVPEILDILLEPSERALFTKFVQHMDDFIKYGDLREAGHIGAQMPEFTKLTSEELHLIPILREKLSVAQLFDEKIDEALTFFTIMGYLNTNDKKKDVAKYN